MMDKHKNMQPHEEIENTHSDVDKLSLKSDESV